VTTGDGFLFERSDAAVCGPWMCDAPWVKANMTHGHEYRVRAGGLWPMRARTGLAEVKAKDLLSDVFYGEPIEYTNRMIGLTRHYGTRDPRDAQNAVNVLDGGARGPRRTSIWLLGWCVRGLYMISADGLPIEHFGRAGIVVQDWRFAVRIANVGLDTKDIGSLLDAAIERLPLCSTDVRPTFYMNASALGLLRDAGLRVEHYCDIPIREVAELRDDEPAVGKG
jgi:hypothetical protein